MSWALVLDVSTTMTLNWLLCVNRSRWCHGDQLMADPQPPRPHVWLNWNVLTAGSPTSKGHVYIPVHLCSWILDPFSTKWKQHFHSYGIFYYLDYLWKCISSKSWAAFRQLKQFLSDQKYNRQYTCPVYCFICVRNLRWSLWAVLVTQVILAYLWQACVLICFTEFSYSATTPPLLNIATYLWLP